MPTEITSRDLPERTAEEVIRGFIKRLEDMLEDPEPPHAITLLYMNPDSVMEFMRIGCLTCCDAMVEEANTINMLRDHEGSAH